MRKRKIKFDLYFDEEELESLNSLCQQTNLNKASLIRYLIKGYCPPESPPADYKTLIRELRAVGNNLNQILVIARTNGILNVPDLRKAISDLREVEMLMREAFTMKKKI